MWRPEPFTRRWGRRAITIPVLAVATLLYLAVLPLFLIHGAVVDGRRGRRQLLARFHLTAVSVLAWHCVGVTALAVWWLVGRARRLPLARWVDFHRALEAWWGDRALRITTRFYNTRYVAEGLDVLAPGPILVLSRHTSTLDTVLPVKLIGRSPVAMVTRIVQKRELLWDPCVDLIGHRVPRTFIRRGAAQPGAELERIVRLCDGMDDNDAVVIYPEGTRFSPARRAEILARLATKAPAEAARAAELVNVLPIRPVGTLALLDARPDMDVVFCAHTGLEEASRLEDLIGGSLLDRTVRVQFWRVPRAEVPLDEAARIDWLHGWWRRVDQWVEQHKDRAAIPPN